MKRSVQTLAVFAALGAAPAARGAVMISEVLYNEVGSDTTGEWVEIVNTGATPVDISGFKFGDEEAQGGDTESGGMWQFPENTTLGAGQVVTVAVSAARFNTVYGKNPSFEILGTDVTVGQMRPYVGARERAREGEAPAEPGVDSPRNRGSPGGSPSHWNWRDV